jgi:hypothetical protein
MRDYLVPPTSTANLGPYARFLADLPDWSDLSQSEYTKAFEALPWPLPSSAPPGFCYTVTHTDIIPDIIPDFYKY